MTQSLSNVVWPISRVGEALQLLCQQSGLTRADSNVLSRIHVGPPTGQTLEEWLPHAANALGVEAELVDTSCAEIDKLIAGIGPALICVDGPDRYVALLRSSGSQLLVLAPDRSLVRIRPAALRALLVRDEQRRVAHTVDCVLQGVDIPASRRDKTRACLEQELMASRRITAGWMLRASPAASLLTQARELELPRLFGLLLGAHTTYFVLWLVSWWLLGTLALQGRLDFGWLIAWGLILLTMIPFRIAVTYVAGLLGVRASAMVKRRLLFGALKLDADQVRVQGVGQLLGRVLETEVLDAMALTGGFLAVTAFIELVLASAVLLAGAAGVAHTLSLIAVVVTLGLIGFHHYRRRCSWTDRRFMMTDDLVERMIGHRTRLAQQPRRQWNIDEDHELNTYLSHSVTLDEALQRLNVVVPRGWLIIALIALAPAFAWGSPSSTALGISIGGILIANRALRDLAEGLQRLSVAKIAWDRVQLFWRSPNGKTTHNHHVMAAATPAYRPNGKTTSGTAIMEAKEVAYRYPRRDDPVVEGVNLCIRTGEKILLQGPSGSGKSTLAATLAGLRYPTGGLLMLHGLDIQSLGHDQWRQRVVMALQFHENHVLMGSFAFNLLMGRRWPPRDNDLDDAESVCRSLGLGPLLERMPAGLQQMIGETGWQLSHGERSRLYTARALLQAPDLLILDESLTALDPESLEQTLQFALKKAPTLVLIAQL